MAILILEVFFNKSITFSYNIFQLVFTPTVLMAF